MKSLAPWAYGPFELLLHAEEHLIKGEDFDRRIALISFDNAIEVAIATYLTLNPIQRGGRSYAKADVERWLATYYTKLEFLEDELAKKGIPWLVDKSHLAWAHDQRNEQYHGGQKGTPEKAVLKIVRDAALWVIGMLFEVQNVEDMLAKALMDHSPMEAPAKKRAFDVAIDRAYEIIEVGEQSYYASELLFGVDDDAYRELGTRLCNADPSSEDSEIEGQA